MATNSIFSSMLNQKPIAAPKLSGGAVKVQKPALGEFAHLNQGNPAMIRPMTAKGNDVASNVWGKMLNQKPKGV